MMNKQIVNAKKKYDDNLKVLSHKSNVLSNIRLLLFITILILLCVLFENKISFLIVVIYILTFLFIGVVIYHYFIDVKKNEVSAYLSIIDEYVMRSDGRWNDFDSHFDVDLDYINDLNLVGKSSLFEYINMTKTKGSKEYLFKKFKLPKTSKEEIEDKQEAIKEITNNFDFVLELESILSNINDSYETDFKKYLYLLDSDMKYNYIPFIISLIFSLISIIMIALSIFVNPVFVPFIVLMALVQTSYAYFYSYHRNKYYQDIFTCSKEFIKLNDTYSYLGKVNMNSKINKDCLDKIKEGSKILDKITNIRGLDSLRNNFITYIICNTVMSLNFLIIYKYHKLLKVDSRAFKESISALECLEANISFATIGFMKKDICTPKISDKLMIEFKDIKYPLLDEKACVSNSFETGEDINIITGSNMSGKTSFMKTIGVNLVLAYNGSYVNAKEFTCSIMNIFTSINVKDDISKGISIFYGELLRIKNILDYSKKSTEPIVIFIDEIFKGTNYNDRIVGAKETLKKLSKIKCIVFLTTHDFELCDIKDKKINNYHFSENYNKNKISFDYKIKTGKCKTTNAMYLMKQMNIIDE